LIEVGIRALIDLTITVVVHAIVTDLGDRRADQSGRVVTVAVAGTEAVAVDVRGIIHEVVTWSADNPVIIGIGTWGTVAVAIDAVTDFLGSGEHGRVAIVTVLKFRGEADRKAIPIVIQTRAVIDDVVAVVIDAIAAIELPGIDGRVGIITIALEIRKAVQVVVDRAGLRRTDIVEANSIAVEPRGNPQFVGKNHPCLASKPDRTEHASVEILARRGHGQRVDL
jgi:hypothetical protein